MALQVAALCYCNQKLTDGRMDYSTARSLLPDLREEIDEIIQTLLALELWDEREGAYWIHDYLGYQPSRAEVLERKAQKREAGRLGGIASAKQRAKRGAKQTLSNRQAEATETKQVLSTMLSDVVSTELSDGQAETNPRTRTRLKEEDLYRQVVDHWLSVKSLIRHGDWIYGEKGTQKIVERLVVAHGLAEVLAAISNYGQVLSSKNHYFDHKWGLEEFMRRGLKKFLDEALPLENFRIKDRQPVAVEANWGELPDEEDAAHGT